jgi:hypothetical protein
MDFPRIRSTFGVTPYNPDRDTEEKRRMIAEHYKDQTSAQPLPDELQPYNVPFPPGQFAQEEFDDMLQRRVVDPLAKAGFEDLGAGLAAVPSAAHSMIVPQTEFDVAGTLIPLPAIAKLMKKGKFRKISKAMHVEDPENAAKIIAEQAGKVTEPGEKIYASADDLQRIKDEGDPVKQISKSKDDMRKRAQKEKMEYDTYKIEEKQKPKVSKSQTPLDNILSKYDEPQASKLREVIKRDLESFEGGNIYIGENFHRPVWQKPNAEYKQPIPIPPEYLDKVGNHVGKNIMYGGNDPFQWLDNKYGASKAWLEKTTGQPRTIETQSDLIAHDDYMDKLTSADKVVFHILGDDNRISRALMPGAPSQDRVMAAAKKLADQGINVTIKRHNIPGRKTDRSSQVIPDGIWLQDETLRLDPEQIKAISKVGGHDFFNSPVIDANVAPLIQQGKDMAKKEFDEIYRSRPGESSKPVAEPPKGPKGDPEASLPRQPDKFAAIRSQLDVAPSRMDERGKAFGDVGQSDFMPYERPSPQFEEVPKRNYVERELDPKEKMWKEIVASDPYINENPEYVKNLRNYFDNRWDQAQGTAEGSQIRMDLPKPDHILPSDEMSISGRYADELAFKKFAKPYDKTRQAERPLERFSRGPNRPSVDDDMEKIDDKITSHFEGYEVQTPGRKLQNEMYRGRPSHEAEQAKLFPKVKEAVKAQSNNTFKAKGGPGYTQGDYRVKDWAGNVLDEYGTYDDFDDAYEAVIERLRMNGLKDDEIDEIMEDLIIEHKNGIPF